MISLMTQICRQVHASKARKIAKKSVVVLW